MVAAAANKNFSTAPKKVSVSERLRLMVDRQEDMASKVRTTKKTMGVPRAGSPPRSLDE